MAITWLGLIASVLVVLNLVPRTALFACFLCFLSFIGASQDFGQYQSDGMLLEAGFLALFLVPAGPRPGLGVRSLAPRAASLLLLWEWFRIYFESGVVQAAVRRPHMARPYRDVRVLPERPAANVDRLVPAAPAALVPAPAPRASHSSWSSCLSSSPSSRDVRGASQRSSSSPLWQICVISTANYAFLNYLVLLLAVLLLDDTTFTRLIPARWRNRLPRPTPPAFERSEEDPFPSIRSQANAPVRPSPARGVRRHLTALQLAITTVALTTIAYVTTAQLVQMLWPTIPLPSTPILALEPFRIANSYGLFANMTPHRYEIEFQGSSDGGATWTPYPFRYKPQDPHDRPRIYAPYQPRFDWNLWFALARPLAASPHRPAHRAASA